MLLMISCSSIRIASSIVLKNLWASCCAKGSEHRPTSIDISVTSKTPKSTEVKMRNARLEARIPRNVRTFPLPRVVFSACTGLARLHSGFNFAIGGEEKEETCVLKKSFASC